MLFENYVKEHDLYYKNNYDKETVKRTLELDKDVAEATNEIITVFNNEFSLIKLNSSILINIAFKCFLKQLSHLKEEEILFYLKEKALSESDYSEELLKRFELIEIKELE